MRPLVLAPVLSLLVLAAPAGAATLELRCVGSGPKDEDSSGTKACPAAPGRARSFAGVVRNDAGQPVAATVVVVRKDYTPSPGGGYAVKPAAEERVVAEADGTFTVRANPKVIAEYEATVQPDPALGIAAAVAAQAKVQRRIVTKVRKLGGGRVRLTVRGVSGSATAQVLDAGGFRIPGIGKQRLRGGRATFRLGRNATGTYSYYVAPAALADLYWGETRRPTFRLTKGR